MCGVWIASRALGRARLQVDTLLARPYYADVKITQLTLLARDLAAQRHFYGEVLGLPVRAREGAVEITTGATTLTFERAPVGWSGVHHFAFNIPENQFAEAKQWLSERAPLHRDVAGRDEFDFRDWNAHAVYAFDGDGNIIELIARHGLRNGSSQPFGAGSLRCVSEIGIAVPDVRALVAQLHQQEGLPIYDGANSAVFSAVGDEHGLFIVVAEQRLWYPDTGLPATPTQTKVCFIDDEGHEVTRSF